MKDKEIEIKEDKREFSDIFKSWFTEEELKLMEDKFNKLKEEENNSIEQNKID